MARNSVQNPSAVGKSIATFAVRPHHLADAVHSRAMTRNVGTMPRNIGTKPRNIGTMPRNIRTKAQNIGTKALFHLRKRIYILY